MATLGTHPRAPLAHLRTVPESSNSKEISVAAAAEFAEGCGDETEETDMPAWQPGKQPGAKQRYESVFRLKT